MSKQYEPSQLKGKVASKPKGMSISQALKAAKEQATKVYNSNPQSKTNPTGKDT